MRVHAAEAVACPRLVRRNPAPGPAAADYRTMSECDEVAIAAYTSMLARGGGLTKSRTRARRPLKVAPRRGGSTVNDARDKNNNFYVVYMFNKVFN